VWVGVFKGEELTVAVGVGVGVEVGVDVAGSMGSGVLVG
jgi:hypothetical protein